MIIIRTNYDKATGYLYHWSSSLIDEAEKRGFKVTKLEEDKISLKNFDGLVNKVKPGFIFFNGHGSKDSLFDNNHKPFLSTENSSLLINTVTFARSCDSLSVLGKHAVERGCKAFIGYRSKFWIARHHPRECQPLKDKTARPILESSNAVVKELIKGKTVQEAVLKSHEVSADYMLKLIYSEEPLDKATFQALVFNDGALGFEGEGKAKI